MNDLRKRPVPEPAADLYSAYITDRSYYWREVIPNIPVTRSDRYGEPLADCAEFNVRSNNYYSDTKPLLDEKGGVVPVGPEVLLRGTILRSLQKLNEALRPGGLSVLVMSGFRSRRLQSLIIANAAKEKDENFARGHFATPGHYLPHASGAALDIEFWDEVNDRLVPTKWGEKVDKYAIEKAHHLSAQDELIRGNRRIIHHLLTDSVVLESGELFVAHPREYWHYGRNERLSAFFSECYGRPHPVFYDEVADQGEGQVPLA